MENQHKKTSTEEKLMTGDNEARFASEKEVKASGLFAEEGVVLGLWNKEAGGQRLLRYKGDGHVLIASPARSGKVGVVVPTALLWKESMLIHDVKGELWSLTAERRERDLNNRCIRFDGTSGDETAARWNPLDEIREYPLDYKDAQHIAEALEDDDEATKNTYWGEIAKVLLVGLILHQKCCCRDKSLAGCYRTITDSNRSLRELLSEMLLTVHDPGSHYRWVDPETGERTATHPHVAAAARTLLNRSEAELSGIAGAVNRFLFPFRDSIIAQNSSESDFSVNDLMNDKQPVSVYLTTPASAVSRVKALHKLLFTLVTHRASENLEFSNGEPIKNYKHKLLLVFDECAQLGKLPILSKQASVRAGCGLQCLFVFQDLSQIYEIYGNDESITSNSDVRIFFTPNKIDTARELSRLLGVMTRAKQSKSFSGRVGSLLMSNMNASEHHSQRSLMNEDEILRLPNSECIILKNGAPAISARKLKYHEWRQFREMFQKSTSVSSVAAND